MSVSDLRKFIREELGKNLRSTDTSPNTFQDLDGYDIQIDSFADGAYTLAIFYYDEKIFPATRFNNREEALSFSRQVVDKDRVKRMNK